MNYLVVYYGRSNIGKTHSIIKAASLLGYVKENNYSDIVWSCHYQGKKVGFASMGDPGSSQMSSIDRLINEKCDIIVCASRSRGQTVDDICTLANKYNYSIIWGHPFYETEDVIPYDMFHEVNARSLLSMIETLSK